MRVSTARPGLGAARRRIGVITTSRADYSHLYWPLRELAAHPQVELGVFALGPHLSPEFGTRSRRLSATAFRFGRALSVCSVRTPTPAWRRRSVSPFWAWPTRSLAWRPDLLLLIADRYEMLAPASAAVALRIPIAHIEGGEVARAQSTTRYATRSPSWRTFTSLRRKPRAARHCHGRGALARASCRSTFARSSPALQAA